MTKQKINSTDIKPDYLTSAITYGNLKSSLDISNGWAGDELNSAEFYQRAVDKVAEYDNYLIDQGPTDSDSSLVIGPLRYTYSVQSIDVAEQRAVTAPATTRSNKPVLIDSGSAYQKASISFTFNGENEINNHLRALIILFKVCPIISIENEMLSRMWSPKSVKVIEDVQRKLSTVQATTDDQALINQSYAEFKEAIRTGKNLTDYLKTNANKAFNDSDVKAIINGIFTESVFSLNELNYIPVCLEDLTIQTIPEIPGALNVSLGISHIDVSSSTETGVITYLGAKPGTSEVNPRRAHWLKAWIRKILRSEYNSAFSRVGVGGDYEGAFGYFKLSFYDKAIGNLLPLTGKPEDLSINSDSLAKILSQSISISNKFAYQRIVGKSLPCVQHLGLTANSLTLTIQFSDDENTFDRFMQFKELSDKLFRSDSIIDRTMGWAVSSPLVQLLGHKGANVFLPLNTNVNTTDNPGIKNCTITLLESNVDFKENTQILLDGGGTPYDDLKAFLLGGQAVTRYDDLTQTTNKKITSSFIGLFNYDNQFRNNVTPTNLSSLILERSPEYQAHSVLFPKDSNGFEGVINRDSIRAMLFSSTLNSSAELREKLLKLPLATGKISNSNLTLASLDAFLIGFGDIGIFGPGSLESGKVGGIKDVAKKLESELFETNSVQTAEITELLLLSLFGLPENAIAAINKIKGSKIKLSNKFREAIFDVLAARPSPISLLSKTYDRDGLYVAFNVLYLEYIASKDLYPSFDKDESFSALNDSAWRQSCYKDIELPSYEELFGDSWRHFAPTYDDIGINYYTSRGVSRPINTNDNKQNKISVSGKDKVPPYIWFYNKRVKNELRKALDNNAQGYLSLAEKRYLSMNLRTIRQSELLRSLDKNKSAELERIANGESLANKDIKGTATRLVEIITQAYSDDLGKIDLGRFQEDLESTRDLVRQEDKLTAYDFNNSKVNKYKVFYQEYLHPDSPKKINLYFTTTGVQDDSPGGYVSSRFQVSPIAGAAYIRIMHELKYTIQKNGSLKDASPLHDEAMTTVGAGNLDVQRRNQRETTLETVKSSLSQIPDDFNSMSKLWPAAKVYFLERRGNDLIADDVYFATDSILSIDITDDKDDAPLAVIKIADPLRYIQNSSFGAGNIVSQKNISVEGDRVSPIILGSRKSNQEGFIKQRKIEQGRAIQIRLGYGANPDHLPIVFTGRITEVEPGDELTIVAQGWKAELINRQVNFYSNNRKVWGAKDLVIQAIQLADPDGIGQHIPEKEANAIISKLRNNQEGVVANSLNNAVDTILVKDAPSIITDITRLLQLDTLDIYNPDARKPGIDTRFKNIWYPDISKTINNFFKWRQFFGIHGPDFINDYWLVPLQPAWDVIKEASRHTWNYIAQVVPYDGEATLFFGHPDQMYYYTRGQKSKIDEWKKYTTQKQEQLFDKVVRLIYDFKKWDDSAPTITFEDMQVGIDFADKVAADIINGKFRYSYKAFKEAAKKDPRVIEAVKLSGVTKANINELDSMLSANSVPLLLYLFYGIKPNRLFLWPDYDKVIRTLLGPLNDGNINLYNEIKKVDTRLSELVNSDILSSGVSSFSLLKARDILDELRFQINTTKNESIAAKDFIDELRFHLKTTSSSLLDLLLSLEKTTKNKTVGTRFTRDVKIFSPKDINAIKAIKALTAAIELSLGSNKNIPFTSLYPTPDTATIEELLNQSDYLFKAFVGYFLQFLKSTNQKEITDVGSSIKDSANFPNMKVFRVHHYIDSDKDIIENSIVTTTSQMWNTVVINRPAENPADTTITDGTPLNQGTQVKTTVNWVYWPKPAVSKVIGLQFHPGISLANKKVKLCTELNCISDELAAKLACNNLADGIKKMYRGTLSIRGRYVKPYDRIILNDRFNGMKGPLEVESVIHHFNPQVGWVTNVIPQAVCDSNPGAAVIQTAIMEANFERVMNVVDTFFNAAYLGTILAAPGVGAALKSVTKGLPAVFNTSLKGSFGIITNSIKSLSSSLARFNYNPITAASFLANRYRGTAKLLFTSYLLEQSIGSIAQHSSNFLIASSWAEGASDKNKTAQLPVILSPLIYNGAPWTAGLEADDILFNVPFYDTYYNFHDLKTAFNDYIGALNR